MGRSRRLGLSRTALAALLVIVAVAVPIVTWWVAGGRVMAREAELKERSVYSHAYKLGLKFANRVSVRIAALLATESGRSFSHYQNLHHDTKGVAEGLAVTVSPLARGPANPDIKVHFQIDQSGRLTLPTVNEQFPELGIESSADCAAIQALEELRAYLAGTHEDESECLLVDDAVRGLINGEDIAIHHVEELDANAWHQHRDAVSLYRALKRSGEPRIDLLAKAARRNDEQVVVVVGDFAWLTMPVDGRPELVALRAVDTPDGLWTQGFVLNRPALDRLIDSEEYPAAVVPLDTALNAREDASEMVIMPIEGTAWAVTVDPEPQLAAAAAWSEDERRNFSRIVLLCAFAAGLAGTLVVALVRQTEHLATQRAQFAASAAHELRTPLAGLRLYGEMLAEGLGDPTRAREYAHRLASEAERLGRVVSNVLSFTRLERSMLRVEPKEGDLATRVREIMDRLEPSLVESGVDVDLAIDEVPSILFDRDAVGHIVQNLVDNAEKYTREIEGRRIEIAVGAESDAVSLSVSDNGPGIARTLRRRLFRPFARGENTGTAEGLGLGLVLVRALVNAQGGEVSYQDAPGGGARFVVRFPRAATA